MATVGPQTGEEAGEEHLRAMYIDVYRQGTKVSVDPASEHFVQIEQEVQSLLTSADDALFLLVQPDTIGELKEGETTLEVIYSTPKAFVVAYNGRDIRASRLLIPLTGHFTGGSEGKVATIFYGDREYSAGPYVNHRGLGELKRLIVAAGIALD